MVSLRGWRPYFPWPGEAAGPDWWRRFPANLVYMVASSLLFALFVARYGRDRDAVPRWLYEFFVYEAPQLTQDVPRTLLNFATAVWLNTHPVQMLYVILLLLMFGIWFEVHEGTARAVLVFYASSIGAALYAGILLHVLRLLFDAAWIERAWVEPWAGGSAGGFGLMGGFAARARNPWPLLSAFVAWEVSVEWWHLRSYTPVFHVAALIIGYGLTRYTLDPRADVSASAGGPRQQAV